MNKTLEQIIDAHHEIMYKLNLRSGGQAQSEAHWPKYLAEVKAFIKDSYVSSAIINKLEEENYHCMISALQELGNASSKVNNLFESPEQHIKRLS